MQNKKNKVKYNLKNTHYAMLNISEDGKVSYGTPVPMPGSVSISLDANGEPENFYKKLSSEVGFRGIAKKVLIFLLVGIANILDVQVIGNGSVLRTAVIFFYISNEGVSLLENAGHLGLPIPEKLKHILAQLHDRAEDGKGDE